jgi:soluble lytic murein transglycosylase-like protein
VPTVKRDGTKVTNDSPVRGRSPSGWRRSTTAARRTIRSRYAEKYRIDPTLVRAVIQVESDFNPACVSHKGARGLMQLMPATAKRYGVKRIHDPEENIRGDSQYLAYLTTLFRDDLPRALAGYNAGENAVLKYGGIPPYNETEIYVKRAMTVYYGRPYGGGAVIRRTPRRQAPRRLRRRRGSCRRADPGRKYLGQVAAR